MVSEAPPIDATPGRGGAGLWSPEHRSLTIGLLLTITLVATEALAVATVMPEVRADLGGYALYGWVFSGFFLASIVGIVAGGRTADRTGLATPFLVGVVVFACGLVVAGLSQSMLVLVVGRLLQGLGAGAVPAVAYAAIARALPSSLRPRMFAMLSTAWVVPGLLGPAAAAAIEHALTWRWVFLGLLPLVVLAAALAVPALAGVTGHVPAGGASDAGPEPSAPGDHDARALPVAAVVAGVGAVLGAAADAPLLLAGATDERFAYVNPNNSGAGGSGCYRYHMELDNPPEGVEDTRSADLRHLLEAVPYWLGPAMRQYEQCEERIPFDQHMLKALVAPRVLLETEGLDDTWSNPKGTWQTHMARCPCPACGRTWASIPTSTPTSATRSRSTPRTCPRRIPAAPTSAISTTRRTRTRPGSTSTSRESIPATTCG